MINRALLLTLILFSCGLFLNFYSDKTSKIQTIEQELSSSGVEQVLLELGAIKKESHYLEKVDLAQAELGKQLVFSGRAIRNGKKSKLISTYFMCTDCHNMVAETPKLSDISSASRLVYSKANNLPFMPGSPFYGIYNRNSFYNDDYVKKYGSLVDDARHDLRRSIQVCAKYCSSGRYLVDWEQEAILHYYKSNELKIKDLQLDASILSELSASKSMSSDEKLALGKKIQGTFPAKYAATFLETMDRNLRKYGAGGNVENGKTIYEESCLFCHADSRVTYLNIDKTQLTAKFFWKNIKNYTDQNLYQILRHGTYAKSGRRQYMPMYTEEKMSDEQINDLVAYVKQLAKVK